MSDKVHGGNGVKAGATSVSIPFRLLSTAGAAVTGKAATDLTAYYWRQGGSPTSISLSDLAAINSSYSSGGVKQADATNMPGLYRLDVPDAALATGADWVAVAVKCSGAMDYEVFIPLESVGNSETYARVGAPAGASISADIAAVPTVEEIDTELSNSHGSGTWGAGGNGGALTLTYTLTSSVDSTPIEGATVELYAEVGMSTLIDSQTTNAFGVATFANLVAGTYYLKRIKSGWSFTNPDSEVVS